MFDDRSGILNQGKSSQNPLTVWPGGFCVLYLQREILYELFFTDPLLLARIPVAHGHAASFFQSEKTSAGF